MSTTEHERIEELLAVRALGGLEPNELVEFGRLRTEHGLDCEVCGPAELEFDEIAGRLGFALGPVAVPDGMEDALVARALDERPAERAPEASADDLALRRAGPAERAPRRPGRLARALTAAAAALVLLVGAFLGGYAAGGGGSNGGTQQALAGYLAHPDTQVVRFTATNGGHLAVAYRAGRDRSYVFGADLKPVPAGKQYELWLFPPGGGKPSRGPTFDAPAPGTAVVVPVPADPSQSVLMAVTVEKAGGVVQPTTEPVFTAPIQTA
ncbi:MAG TPA: anti-sigma factor [Actinomycetota bacterium]|jgi:hypothetical protein